MQIEGTKMEFEIKDDKISELNKEEKKKYLFRKQKQTLDSFLERNAISKQQYDKSLWDLKEKMGIIE